MNETEHATNLAKQMCRDASVMQEDAVRMLATAATMRDANDRRRARLRSQREGMRRRSR